MIILANDTITFESASADAALADCAVHYAQQWLPRILAENPSVILKQLLSTNYAWFSAEQRRTVTRAVSRLTPDGMEAEFTRQVSERINAHKARVSISFQRTLRLPADGKTYPLPPGLGRFPLRPVDLFARRLPASWSERGGLLMPMYQAEALWLNFEANYPWALKVSTGLTNALTGSSWHPGLQRHPQDYLVLPEQPWLDGFCSQKGVVSQFVAAPLGKGYTAEEQLQHTAHGGLQLEASPLKAQVYFTKHLQEMLPKSCATIITRFICRTLNSYPRFSLGDLEYPGMGLGSGGKMKQEIYEDPWEPADWDLSTSSRVWINICDVINWFKLTGELPPNPPFTVKAYTRHRLPWFDYYRDDLTAIEGSPELARLKSVFTLASEKQDDSIPEDEAVSPKPMTPEARKMIARIFGA